MMVAFIEELLVVTRNQLNLVKLATVIILQLTDLSLVDLFDSVSVTSYLVGVALAIISIKVERLTAIWVLILAFLILDSLAAGMLRSAH